jgi:hypothetical protein
MSRVHRILVRCSILLLSLAIGGCQGGPPDDLVPVVLEDGRYEVVGWIIATSDSVKVCGNVLDSYPPLCGSEGLILDGLDPAAVAGAQSARGVIWTENRVRVVGHVESGRMQVDEVTALD